MENKKHYFDNFVAADIIQDFENGQFQWFFEYKGKDYGVFPNRDVWYVYNDEEVVFAAAYKDIHLVVDFLKNLGQIRFFEY